MKELSIEEKSKRYDEALEMAKKLIENEETNVPVFYVNNIKDIFPELKESIDERIKKVIKQVLSESTTEKDECYLDNGVTQQEVFAWLEKQGEQPKKHDVCDNCDQQGCCVSPCPMKLVEKHGEQKPVDKVEPKFHEGEWVVFECGEETATLQITRIVGETYVFSDDSTLSVVDEDTLRLWDITKDAKDGDVLAADPWSTSSFVAIYKKQNEEDFNSFDSYCFVGFDGKFYEGECGHSTEYIHPATKEQRDLLFQRMKEAGYEWDEENKELNKIEQKPAWSEDDESMLYGVIETEQYMLDVVTGVKTFDVGNEQIESQCTKELAWLKILKERYTWKPSDKQIEALESATVNCAYSEYQDCLKELIVELKKLKG